MTAKEYLLTISIISENIKQKEIILQELRQNLLRLSTQSLDQERVQTSITQDDNFIRDLDRTIKLEKQIKTSIDTLNELKIQIIDQISGLSKPEHVKLLLFRYVNGYSLRKISEMTNYSWDRTRHLHGDALKEFGRKYKISTL